MYYQVSWRLWTALSRLVKTGSTRQSFLSLYGPLSLLMLFAIWACGLVAGYAFIHYALDTKGNNLADSLYLSGSTFTTLGYGDVSQNTPASRTLSVVESATGVGFFAMGDRVPSGFESNVQPARSLHRPVRLAPDRRRRPGDCSRESPRKWKTTPAS